ncbi:MAG: hypothetical protein IJC48_09870 [Clostridia bacterium]|nr:hypothetical protein [Clostridia bacterium]
MNIKLNSDADLKALLREIGFIPLFESDACPGCSVEALTIGQWWTGRSDDPWHWRETLSEDEEILYGKFFSGRAGFITKEWLPKFANYRRDGYDFDSLEEEGLAAKKLSDVMEVVEREGRILSNTLKKAAGAKGYEGAVTALQMKMYLFIDGFGRRVDKSGRPYGWSIAYLSKPENRYGYDFTAGEYCKKPEISYREILSHALKVFPYAEEDALSRLISVR